MPLLSLPSSLALPPGIDAERPFASFLLDCLPPALLPRATLERPSDPSRPQQPFALSATLHACSGPSSAE
eukprot:3933455-Rhodomonas_salina.2